MSVGDVQKLTPRQKEILRLLVNGYDAKSVSRELDISVHTVTEHLREARRHLGVSSSREAARILRQTESGPPIKMGPSTLRVVGATTTQPSSGQLSPNRRLAYVGVSLMILVAAAAFALFLSGGSPVSEPLNTSSNPGSAPSAASANPSPYQSRDVAVGTFDRLTVSGPFQVGVVVSNEPARVLLQGPPALLADTIVTVEGDTLSIHFREGATWSWNPGSGMNVVVFTPSLASVSLQGAADVEVNGARGETFAAATEGSGRVRATGLDVGRVRLVTGGAGGISVEGSAREATYMVGGAGSIDAMRLRVRNANIAVDGEGSSYANVSGTATVSMTGGGRVEVVGGATCIKRPADSRRIECR